MDPLHSRLSRAHTIPGGGTSPASALSASALFLPEAFGAPRPPQHTQHTQHTQRDRNERSFAPYAVSGPARRGRGAPNSAASAGSPTTTMSSPRSVDLGNLTLVPNGLPSPGSTSAVPAVHPPSPVAGLFADLPPPPPQPLYHDLVGLYFEKLPPTLAIVHRDRFLASLGAAEAQRPPSYLVFSMTALSALYHPSYSPDLARTTFYERAKRLILTRLADRGMADLNTVKTVLHLCAFTMGQGSYQAAYFWLGTAVQLSRTLGMYSESAATSVGDSETLEGPVKEDWQFQDGDLDLTGTGQNSGDDVVEKEERRRCYWAIRNYDMWVRGRARLCGHILLTITLLTGVLFLSNVRKRLLRAQLHRMPLLPRLKPVISAATSTRNIDIGTLDLETLESTLCVYSLDIFDYLAAEHNVSTCSRNPATAIWPWFSDGPL